MYTDQANFPLAGEAAMGGTAVHRPESRTNMTDEDFASIYRARLGHLEGFFRGKGVGREEASDLAHETVLRTMLHLKRHGRSQEDVGPLTRTIARNLIIERLRRQAPVTVCLSDGIDAPDEAPGPSELAIQRERREIVQAAMSSLTPRHRRVIELWMQGRSPVEIARELGIKRNAADAILHRARRALASRLGPKALWGSVAIAWFKMRAGSKHAAHTLAAWSPDSVAVAPVGVSIATVGLVAVLTLGGSGPGTTPARQQLRDTTPVAAQRAVARPAAESAVPSASAPRVEVPRSADVAPTYEMSVDTPVRNPASDDEGLLDIRYRPEAGSGRGPVDQLLEPAFERCVSAGDCSEEND
jgi:RNA polymerase sigma factor (sigma-70 family)